MARQPVRNIELNAQLNPVASPVDTFVQAPRSPLKDLAESLSSITPELQKWSQDRAAKSAEDNKLRGEAAFYKDHEGEMAEAVRSGKVPSQYSPSFIEGFKNAQGLVAGGGLREKFNAAFDAWDGKNSEDPAAFDTFLSDFLDTELQTDDPKVLAGLLPSVREIQANGRARYIEYRHKQTYNGSLDANTAAAVQAVDTANQEGLASEEGTDYPAMFASIEERRAAFVSTGGNPEDFDKAMTEAMSAKILELKDPKMLDWFKQKVPGQDYAYGETPDGLKIKNATIEGLEQIARQEYAGEHQRQKDQAAKLLDEAQAGIVQAIIADPNAEIPEALLQQAEKNGDGTIRTKIKGWRESLNSGELSDPKKLKSVTAEIMTNPNADPMMVVRKAMEQGVFKNNADLQAAVSFANSWKGGQEKIAQTLEGTVARDILTAIRARTQAKTDMGDPITGISNEGFEAQYDFRRLVSQWLVDNPNATASEIEEQTVKFGKMITDRFSDTGGDMFAASEYNRSPDLGFDNPYTDGTAPVDGADTGAQDTQAEPPATESTPQEVEKFIQELTPEQRSQLEQLGQQQGLTLEDQVKEIFKADPSVKPIAYDPNDPDLGEGDPRSAGITVEQASGFIEQALDTSTGSDEMSTTANLRKLIMGAESGGNYNAVFGDANSTVDLSQFTVDDILAQQQWARKNGYPSTAIGAGQFLYKTMRGLKAEMGMTGKEKFTPGLQDKMMDHLLDRRGLQQYRAGTISKRQFALRLSQEWAALPNPNTGRSFYAGDGLNRARVPASAVYRAMGMNVSYDPQATAVSGQQASFRFNHPEQEAGVNPELKGIVGGAFAELGIPEVEVMSGFRSRGHAAERGKKSGGGEHTHGSAMDVSMRGLSNDKRQALVKALVARGAKRFITYSKYPDMLHVDLKDQNGDGSPYFMHNKTAKKLNQAPAWYRAIALGATDA